MRKEKEAGSASRSPSIAVKVWATGTVSRVSAGSGALGISRIVTGSRHSRRPGIAGSTRRTVAGSTVRSSDPATGRSKVTVIIGIGPASPTGVVRMIRSGAAAEPAVSEAVTAARRARRRADIIYGSEGAGLTTRGGNDGQRDSGRTPDRGRRSVDCALERRLRTELRCVL